MKFSEGLHGYGPLLAQLFAIVHHSGISSDAGLYTYRDCLCYLVRIGIVLISLLSWGFFGQRLDLQLS